MASSSVEMSLEHRFQTLRQKKSIGAGGRRGALRFKAMAGKVRRNSARLHASVAKQ